MLSGPAEKKKVPLRPRAARLRHSRGTPSRVPRQVSTSMRRPIFMTVASGGSPSGGKIAGGGSFLQEEIDRGLDRLGQINRRTPIEQPTRFADAGPAMLDILVAGAVILAAFHFLKPGERGENRAQRVAL